jgi:hypothetical protein
MPVLYAGCYVQSELIGALKLLEDGGRKLRKEGVEVGNEILVVLEHLRFIFSTACHKDKRGRVVQRTCWNECWRGRWF